MSETAPSNASKKLARLVAVQALYQDSYGEEELRNIVAQSVDESAALLNGAETGDPEITTQPDATLVHDIVYGVHNNLDTVRGILDGALEGRTADRLEILLRTILFAGIFELHHHADVPQGVIISDYVDVTRAFFQAKEPGLVNALLDKIAQKLRS